MDGIESVEQGARFVVDARAGEEERGVNAGFAGVVDTWIEVFDARVWRECGCIDLAAYLQGEASQERRIELRRSGEDGEHWRWGGDDFLLISSSRRICAIMTKIRSGNDTNT